MRQINWMLVRWVDSIVGIPLVWLLSVIRRPDRRPHPQARYRRILLIKFWGIGNLFMVLPSIKALKERYPEARLELLTLMTNHEASRSIALFSAVHLIDTSSYLLLLRTLLGTIIALRRKEFDLVIDFEQFARVSALVTSLAGRGRTIGFKTEGQRRDTLYTDPVIYTNELHITKAFFLLVRAAGCDEYPASIDGSVTVPNPEAALRLIGPPGNNGVVIMHVGTSKNFEWRRWPAGHFARLADSLIDALAVKILFTGIAEERALIDEVQNMMKRPDQSENLGGRLSFADYLAIINTARFVVAADTSTVHIASAMGIGIVGLYGPNTPALYGPWGEGRNLIFYDATRCSPCITNYNAKIHVCKLDGACMKDITPERVFEGVMRVFA